MDYFIYDGACLKDAPVIGPDSRALRYGDGLYETMKCIDGQLAFADEHFSRLWKGMQVLGFEIPRHFTAEMLQSCIAGLLKKNKHEALARIRLSVFRGDGGLYDPVNHQPHFTIQTWALEKEHGTWNTNGLVAGIYEDARKSCDILANLKHNNFLPYILAAQYAKSSKWNDAILLNSHNRVCDSSMANIFLVKDEQVITVSLEEGCIAGIMRKVITRELKLKGYSVEEKAVTVNELLEAGEVFLTNSIKPIRWVKEIGNKLYSSSFTQKIYTELSQTIL